LQAAFQAAAEVSRKPGSIADGDEDAIVHAGKNTRRRVTVTAGPAKSDGPGCVPGRRACG
jgi:hypothetical protein